MTAVTGGFFITFEGGEGAGKSTQARRLAERLRAMGRAVTLTREPGGSVGAEAIRALLVRGEADRWSPVSETLLMYAARRDHIERTIAPALDRGEVVICDRFLDSTRAYQGAGGGAPTRLIAALEEAVVAAVRPDLTLVFDLPVEVGMARATARGRLDRFELETRVFFEAVRSAFLKRAEADPARYYLLDAALPLTQVQQSIDALLPKLVERVRG